ncbi:Gp138 family membrane-puncturing spike protein [Leptospira santarosai]|uniref:Gp138 family membrane-puncturing spike protein n=1 Tax=Leptospira santarosai TaxID=28183 RepID=UPI0026E46391|nr:Gp138 family membrane-puncturing spike protein [Leptospira santarosai]MDO6395287.1 Gp138 family membrane-puncturing spike protein [Leptospira santarosai]
MSLDDVILKAIKKQLANVQVGLPGTIESFNPSLMTANVKLLFKQINGQGEDIDFPVLSNIRVGTLWAGDFFIKPDYKRGDKVWVSFSTHDTSDAIRGISTVASESLFDLQSACVQSGFKGDLDAPAFTANLPGLLIGHKQGKSLIQLDDDTIKIRGGLIDLSESAVLGETLSQFLKMILDVFINNASAFTTNTIPGSPAGLSPAIVTALTARKSEVDQILSYKVKIG